MTILLLSILLQDYWISELGSDDIDRRDQITQILLSRGRWDSLYAARKKTRDSEVRARLDLVLRAWWKPLRYGIGLPTTSISWSWDERMDRYTARLSCTGILEITHRHGWAMSASGIEAAPPFRLFVGAESLRLCLLAMETDYFDMQDRSAWEPNEGGGVLRPNDWSVTYRSGLGPWRTMRGTGMMGGEFPLFSELGRLAQTALAVDRWIRELASDSFAVHRNAALRLMATSRVSLPALLASRTTDAGVRARIDGVVRTIQKRSGRAIRDAGFAQKG